MRKKKNLYIQFCISNLTHARMWQPLIPMLRKLVPSLKIGLLSLDSYYAQSPITSLTGLDADNLTVIERRWSQVSYWNANAFDKLIIMLEVRLRIKALFELQAADLIVLGNDIGIIERIVIKKATRLRIPTLLVQDGILRMRNRLPGFLELTLKSLFFRAIGLSANRVYGLGETTAVAVMGQHTYDLLKEQGKDMRRVFITGQPRFDEYATIINTKPSEDQLLDLRSELGIPIGSKVVVFFSQPLISYKLMASDNWDQIIASVLFSARELIPRNCVLIKLHPAEDLHEFRARYSKYLAALGEHVLINKNTALTKILQLADAVIVHSSTVALEAILFDKPVIIFHPHSFVDDYRFVELGAAIHASTVDDLLRHMESLLRDKEICERLRAARAQAVAYHIGSLDGAASVRVSELILGLYRDDLEAN